MVPKRAQPQTPESTVPNRRRQRLFRIITISVPFLFFLVLESGLWVLRYGGNLDLFIPVESGVAGDAAYLMTNPDVARRYFSRVGRVPMPPPEVLLEEKPANGYRIFVMGGSTVAGFPYPNHVMPSRVLDARLSDPFPNRHIEVISVGIAAVNSFTLLDLTDKVLDSEPDAILIYAGHNEFYGALGAASVESFGNSRWIVNAYLSLLDWRTMRLLGDAYSFIAGGQPAPSRDTDTDYEETYPTLMSRVIASTVPFGSDAYRKGERDFSQNLDEILEMITAARVPVLVSELVSNVRDMRPLASEETDLYPPANTVFELARVLEETGDYDKARDAYYEAKDLDALRFRASEDFNAIIHQVARKHGVPVVPMKARFESASPNGLIGANLMLEHLHPNVEGYMLMADAFFEAMRLEGLIEEEWDSALIRPASWYAEHWPVTELDRALGRLVVMDLMDYWPFRAPSDPGNAFATFQAASPAEEAAYRVATDEVDFVQAHTELAEVYAARGETEKASLEYEAIRASDPFDNR